MHNSGMHQVAGDGVVELLEGHSVDFTANHKIQVILIYLAVPIPLSLKRLSKSGSAIPLHAYCFKLRVFVQELVNT